MEDKSQKSSGIEARRKSCGYRIQFTCSNCVNCKRTFEGASHAERMMAAVCDLHGFDVYLERGICNYFDHIGKYRT